MDWSAGVERKQQETSATDPISESGNSTECGRGGIVHEWRDRFEAIFKIGPDDCK